MPKINIAVIHIDKTITIKHCVECPYHKVVSDPDPDDWFNDDDCAILCTQLEKSKDSRFPYKAIDVALRPYQVDKVKVPSYCPLLNENI